MGPWISQINQISYTSDVLRYHLASQARHCKCDTEITLTPPKTLTRWNPDKLPAIWDEPFLETYFRQTELWIVIKIPSISFLMMELTIRVTWFRRWQPDTHMSVTRLRWVKNTENKWQCLAVFVESYDFTHICYVYWFQRNYLSKFVASHIQCHPQTSQSVLRQKRKTIYQLSSFNKKHRYIYKW